MHNYSFKPSSASIYLLSALVFWLGMVQPAQSQSQEGSCRIATGGADPLTISFLLECSSLDANGALHYYVAPNKGPSASDRELDIEFSISPSTQLRSGCIHRFKIQLKEGATSTEGRIYFPVGEHKDIYQQRTQYWNVQVREDGDDVEASRWLRLGNGNQFVPVKVMPGDRPPPMTIARNAPGGAILHVLQSDESLVPWFAERMSLLVTRTPFAQPVNEGAEFNLARDYSRATNIRNIESLPEQWQYYLQFSVLTFHAPTFERLKVDRPRAAEAIKQYVTAGGKVVLIAAEGNGAKLVDQWLQNDDQAEPSRNWMTPQFNAEAKELLQSADSKELSESDWTVRSVARGSVFVFNKNPRVVHGFEVLSSVLQPVVGMASGSSMDEAWSFRNLISSVGKPPVWTFCVIVLLFGLILGPGLLVLTGWIGRRSLLILLVPLVSFGATCAIVAYQVLHEGFGTHVRISSAISVDERTGTGFVWSRQTYYSSWPPREGFVIPKDVYFRPVQNASLNYRGGINRRFEITSYSVEHTSEESRCRGLLPSQEQKQFLVGHPAKVSMPIQVKVIDAKTIMLKNLTKEPLPFVVLRDGGDGYFMHENIPPQAQVELSSQPFGDLAGSLSRIRNQLIPSLPPELRTMGWGASQAMNGSEIIDQAWMSNLAEQSNQSGIPPFGFVTAVRQCDAVFVPLKVNSNESLHLITGSALW